MAPLIQKLARGRSGPKEPYDSSSFELSNTTRVRNNFTKHNFDRLEGDTADLTLGRGRSKSIRQTTNINVHEEDRIASHRMA